MDPKILGLGIWKLQWDYCGSLWITVVTIRFTCICVCKLLYCYCLCYYYVLIILSYFMMHWFKYLTWWMISCSGNYKVCLVSQLFSKLLWWLEFLNFKFGGYIHVYHLLYFDSVLLFLYFLHMPFCSFSLYGACSFSLCTTCVWSAFAISFQR